MSPFFYMMLACLFGSLVPATIMMAVPYRRAFFWYECAMALLALGLVFLALEALVVGDDGIMVP